MLFEILQRLKNENFYWNIGFYALVLAGLTHFIFIFLFLFLDVQALIIINILSVLIYLYCIFGLALKTLNSKDDSLIGWLVYFELIAHGVLATYYIGLESGFQYYMYTLVFIPFFTWAYSTLIRLFRMIGVIVVALLLEYWGHTHIPIVLINAEYINVLHYINLSLLLIIGASISYFYSVQSNMYLNRLFKQSNTDALTNLYNRRYVDDVSKKRVISCQNKGISFALLLMDIDYFKKINDVYGHKCGDKVLIKLAQILRENVRETTVVSRWGGEEFLIILENIDTQELVYLSERLRKVIEKTEMIADKSIHITITLGGAIGKEDETFEIVLARADKALYEGKKNGRNQTVIV